MTAQSPGEGAMTRTIACVPACWTPERCDRCGREKQPRGRSVPLPAAGGYCDYDCPGYGFPKRHLWDEHDDSRFYVDPEGWREHEASCRRCGPDEDDE